MKISVSHPDRVSAGRAPMAGSWVTFRITVTNDESVIHRRARIHFNPVGPTTEMWWISDWFPKVLAEQVPGQGLLFDVGDLAPGQSFSITIKSIAPVITQTKVYPIEVEFESSEKPREVLHRGEITVVAR